MKPDKVVLLVEQLYSDCEKAGTLKVVGFTNDYIYWETFRGWIAKNRGIDHHTIKAYKDLFESYKFLRFDDYKGTVEFIYKDNLDYKKIKSGGNLTRWF